MGTVGEGDVESGGEGVRARVQEGEVRGEYGGNAVDASEVSEEE